eukprot:TRINITY_DN7936_c0_g1_i1.p1 TRINITY_DN7936_c0_g1~~TRINITY_DN7936_c0_g1_i1.p1  ORF type:complete len:242 (-),score=26.71 TRINITY_DN7936_c0_g1_i1:13-738(-)
MNPLLRFFGYLFLSLSPSFSVFYFVSTPKSIRVVLAIGSAFFWLLSFLLTSILWYVISPLRDNIYFGLFLSLPFQEVFRFFYFKLYMRLRRAERQTPTPVDDISEFFSIGVGGGVMQVLVFFSPFLWESRNDGVLFLPNCALNLFEVSALTSFCVSYIHILLSPIALIGYKTRSVTSILGVIVIHVFVSGMTLLFGRQNCGIPLGIIFGSLICVLLLDYKVVTSYLKSNLHLNVQSTSASS